MSAAEPASTLEVRFALRRETGTMEIDFAVPAAGITALFGPSGAGKTTCLRVLAGIESVPGAWVRLGAEVWQDGRRGVFRPPERRALGYVFQEARLFPHLNVRENLAYGQRRRGRREPGASLGQVAKSLRVGHLLERDVRTLSGGESQRVALARALLAAPRLLLLDEPLASLDATHKAEILPLLEQVQRDYRLPVVYVSHAIEEVVRLADHVVMLDRGRVVAQGPAVAVLQRAARPLAVDDKPVSVIEGRVSGYDATFGLLALTWAGGIMRWPRAPETLGHRARMLVRASDVSLTRVAPVETSILNVVWGRVVGVSAAADPAQSLVTVEAGGARLLALVTRYSCAQLNLAQGGEVWIQLKAVALVS